MKYYLQQCAIWLAAMLMWWKNEPMSLSVASMRYQRQGMLLAARSQGGLHLITVDPSAEPGAKVS